MGLDMYLNKMPRYRGCTAHDVCKIEDYLDYINACKDPNSEARNYTLEQWTGSSENEIPKGDPFKFYQHFYNTKYAAWDAEHRYGHDRIIEQVGYWRKANQIHNWFVDNVQGGIDDCNYHQEVTKEKLEELLDVCQEVLCNPDVAEDRLSTRAGFFFGDTSYDEYYMEDIKSTIDIITQVLETTDFDVEMIYYISSW